MGVRIATAHVGVRDIRMLAPSLQDERCKTNAAELNTVVAICCGDRPAFPPPRAWLVILGAVDKPIGCALTFCCPDIFIPENFLGERSLALRVMKRDRRQHVRRHKAAH